MTKTAKTPRATRKPRTVPAPSATAVPDAAERVKVLKSVITAAYRAKYREHGGSNGDEIATQLAAYTKDGPDGLVALAEANSVWKAEYLALNPGQRRMTVGNRLRALVRKGQAVVWPID